MALKILLIITPNNLPKALNPTYYIFREFRFFVFYAFFLIFAKVMVFKSRFNDAKSKGNAVKIGNRARCCKFLSDKDTKP